LADIIFFTMEFIIYSIFINEKLKIFLTIINFKNFLVRLLHLRNYLNH
jgi:hypothetical protein